jgi:hypothetical protein
MTLLSEKKPRIGPSRKTKWMIVLGLIVVTVTYSVIYNALGGGRSVRVKEYLEKKELATTSADSSRINMLYAKLFSVYSMLKDTDYCKMPELLFTKQLPANFESKLITSYFLKYLFDSTAITDRKASVLRELDETMGSGNFTGEIAFRKFNAGFANDAKYILDENYILVLISCKLARPSFVENTKTFEAGFYSGQIMVVNLAAMKVEGVYYVEASTDDEIKSIPYKKGHMDGKLMDNLLADINRKVEDASVKIFGRNLKNNYK